MTATVAELVAFIEAQIAEDERVAREADVLFVGRPWHKGPYAEDEPAFVLAHIARHDPARVLADCEAKKALLKDCRRALRKRGGMTDEGYYALRTLRALALAWKGAEGWKVEWG